MWATHEEVKVVDPHNGLLSPYVLTLMVVHFLQVGAFGCHILWIPFYSLYLSAFTVWNIAADSPQPLQAISQRLLLTYE